MKKRYCYTFVRQDLSKEQQLVQACHSNLVAGSELDDYDEPWDIHFVIVGVRNEEALFAVEQILNKFNIEYRGFIEPYFKNSLTSITTLPILEDERGPLLSYNILKFE